jgi:hypothetical protein
MLMKNRGPFTPEEKVLNDLNFDTYADPIARSIENLDLASRRWATQIAQIPISSGDARKKELNRLGKLKREYIRAFAGAARTLVEESTKRINEHEYAAIKEYSPLTVESQPIHAKLGRFAFDSAASAIRGINRFRKAK